MTRQFRLKSLTAAVAALIAIQVLAAPGRAQERAMSCNDGWGDRPSFCEIREQTLAASGSTINVDGRRNGGVSVKGWDRAEVLVRARVQAQAGSEAEARELAGQIRVETGGLQIHAVGPDQGEGRHWSVSYEVFVPRQSNLALKAHNGGISITDVRGQIEFEAHNGGVSLKGLAGNVRGQTTNGGLSIDLAGSRWEGEGMDVRTTNGGVNLQVPENYSARLETSTVNGGLNVGFPVAVEGRVKKELAVDLGSGGATLRAVTTNGGVSLKRKG